MKEKLSENNIDVNFGTILSLRAFFYHFCNRERIGIMSLKNLFNARLLFDPLVAQAKKYQNDVTDSITKLFKHNCKCTKSENGYYQWNCVAGKCSECKLNKPMPFECASSEQKIKISQFEVTETPYKKNC